MSSSKPLIVRHIIPAPPEEVFDAWLDAKSLGEFMRPGPGMTCTAKTDPRVGGKFEILMKGEKEDYPHRGEYRVIQRPSKLVFTWISKATKQNESVVTVEFLKKGKDTEVVLTHTGLPVEEVDNHKGGWTEILSKLGALAVR
jgi:uncharacterized protein YndB with AHSA1/START domain